MRSKTFYTNMGMMHFVAMLLFIIVFFIGVVMSHWVTFDFGLFGAIIACISTVYNVIQCEKAEKLEKNGLNDESNFFEQNEEYDEY